MCVCVVIVVVALNIHVFEYGDIQLDLDTERCLRCVPHDEDTGGFFVATLRKIEAEKEGVQADEEVENEVVQLDEEVEKEEEALPDDVDAVVQAEGDEVVMAEEEGGDTVEKEVVSAVLDGATEVVQEVVRAPPLYKVGGMTNKGLVDFKPWSEAAYTQVAAEYGFSAALPRECFMVREDYQGGGVSSKGVFYMPASVRALLGSDTEGRLKVVCAGVKVLERRTARDRDRHCAEEYRLIQVTAW